MKRLLLSVLALLSGFNLLGQRTLIHCGQLFDGTNGTLKSTTTIVVDKNKIIAVENGFMPPNSTDKVIDLKSKTVLPGLIDMHVHLESETAKDQFQKRIQQNMADIAYSAQRYALTTLKAGFTTVRDLGGSGANISLRNAINSGLVAGPRILTSGKTIATTGGHGDPSNGIKPDLQLPAAALDGVINSADEARQAIRQRYKDGVDWIKITAPGGVLSIAKSGKAPQFQDDELEALIKTANDYGLRVAAHAHGAEGMKRALRAGVTTIEHGSFLDEECIRLFKQRGAYLVPTIIAGKSVADSAKIMGYYHPLVVPKAIETGKLIQDAFGRAYKAGVKIGFGTDAGVYMHGKNAMEFQYMVEAGMPMAQALLAATKTNAEILEMSDKIGSIEAGKLADIIAVDGDPLKDTKVMQNVVFVMKDGLVYKQ